MTNLIEQLCNITNLTFINQTLSNIELRYKINFLKFVK